MNETTISLETLAEKINDENRCIIEFEEDVVLLVLCDAILSEIHTLQKEEEGENNKFDEQESNAVDFCTSTSAINVKESASGSCQESVITAIMKVLRSIDCCSSTSTETRRGIGHYNYHQKILLVGEGDFSFAASLATAFGSASNLTATSLDSRDTVITEYSRAAKHLAVLEERGASVIHKVDVYTMKNKPQLKNKLFDRIVFNFPHSGDTWYERGWSESDSCYIECHQEVVKGFFKTGRKMLSEDGEIHVTHKTTNPFDWWEIEELAEFAGLVLTGKKAFDRRDYPGYENKKAYGKRWDKTFPVGESCTFIFSKP